MECAILTKCLSKLYYWVVDFVNVEGKEYLQLKVKVLNKLASVIKKALKMNELAV